MRRSQRRLAKSIAAGAAAGLLASAVMGQVQSLIDKAAGNNSKVRGKKPGEDATVKTARAIARTVFRRDLSGSQKGWAGPAVHFAFGTFLGALYGFLAEASPAVRSGRGTAFGSLVWLGAHELAVPALRLSESPVEMPVTQHVEELATHLVYGAATDLVRSVVLG